MGIRVVLTVAAVLVFSIGTILYLLSGMTDRLFAWTVQVPLTASFLGAAYLSTGFVELAAARQRVWVYSRLAGPAVLLFATLTLAVTVVHRDAFHFGPPNGAFARVVAWVWLLVYAAFPVAMAVMLTYQRRAPGLDPPRRTLAPWVKVIMAVQALVMTGTGVVLLFGPAWAAGSWPWPLTRLTAQAIGAWGIGLGVGVAQAIWENDWRRMRVGVPIFIVFGALGLLAMLRDADSVHWGRPSAWALVIFLVSLVLGGAYAFIRARREMAPETPDGDRLRGAA